MRKILSILLLVLLTAALISCNQDDAAAGASQMNSVTKSYTTARNQFKDVTGIELPLLPDIEVSEDSYKDYKQGDTFYHFHTTVNDALTIETYMYFEDALKDALGKCTTGPTEDSNVRTATWEINGRKYTATFNKKPGKIMIDTELL